MRYDTYYIRAFLGIWILYYIPNIEIFTITDFYPAVWPALFCHKGITSKQPRQAAQEWVQVPSPNIF